MNAPFALLDTGAEGFLRTSSHQAGLAGRALTIWEHGCQVII